MAKPKQKQVEQQSACGSSGHCQEEEEEEEQAEGPACDRKDLAYPVAQYSLLGSCFVAVILLVVHCSHAPPKPAKEVQTKSQEWSSLLCRTCLFASAQ